MSAYFLRRSVTLADYRLCLAVACTRIHISPLSDSNLREAVAHPFAPSQPKTQLSGAHGRRRELERDEKSGPERDVSSTVFQTGAHESRKHSNESHGLIDLHLSCKCSASISFLACALPKEVLRTHVYESNRGDLAGMARLVGASTGFSIGHSHCRPPRSCFSFAVCVRIPYTPVASHAQPERHSCTHREFAIVLPSPVGWRATPGKHCRTSGATLLPQHFEDLGLQIEEEMGCEMEEIAGPSTPWRRSHGGQGWTYANMSSKSLSLYTF